MQLQAQLRVGAAILLTVAAGISGYVFHGYAKAYQESTRNLQALASYDQVLKAGNTVSAERAPTNILLSLDQDAGQNYDIAESEVAGARLRTDLALDQLQHLVQAQAPPRASDMELAQVRATLAQARVHVDQLIRHAPSDRSPQVLQNTIDRMVAARMQLDPLIDAFYSEAIRNAPDQAGIMQMARILSDLREYGERIGAMLVVPLSTPEPISATRQQAIAILRGHIDQLHQLMPRTDALAMPHSEAIHRLRTKVDRDFFGHTLPLIDTLVARSGSDYVIRAAAFTSAVMPDLNELEQLENLFMRSAVTQVSDIRREDRTNMLLIGACLLAFFCFLLIALRMAERVVVHPLLLARKEIIGLAHGDLRHAPRAGNSAEVRALHDAIDTLRQQHVRRLQLAVERDELSKALRQQAHTDALTGLLNRHALEEITGDLSAEPTRLSKGRGLILIDVDHFKPINDEYGHVVGDLVLREVAGRIRHRIAEPHMAFRYGGEEFAVLTNGLAMEALCQLAEDIRHTISRDAFIAPDGSKLSITASFGVAKGNAIVVTWLDLLNAADEALYRAKAQGRNQLVAASECSNERTPDSPDDLFFSDANG